MLLTVSRGLCVWTTPGQREDGLIRTSWTLLPPLFVSCVEQRMKLRKAGRGNAPQHLHRQFKETLERELLPVFFLCADRLHVARLEAPSWSGMGFPVSFLWIGCSRPPCPVDLRAPVWCSSCPSRCSLGLRFPVRRWTRPPLQLPPSCAGESLQEDNSSTHQSIVK